MLNLTAKKFVMLSVMLISTGISAHRHDPSTELTLKQAIKQAQENDPWLLASRHTQDAVESMSVAVDTLPDPKISIGLANIASDSLHLPSGVSCAGVS